MFCFAVVFPELFVVVAVGEEVYVQAKTKMKTKWWGIEKNIEARYFIP